MRTSSGFDEEEGEDGDEAVGDLSFRKEADGDVEGEERT